MEQQKMTRAELVALKKERYATATENGNIKKLYSIGRALGKPLNATYGPKYQYNDAGLMVYVDDYGNYMQVCYEGNLVCSTHFCDGLYIPGDWETLIPQLFEIAEQAQHTALNFKEERERQTLAHQMGIKE